jgi:hypothetical protein
MSGCCLPRRLLANSFGVVFGYNRTKAGRGDQSLLAVASCDRQADECRIGDYLRRFLRHSSFVIRHSHHILLIPGTSSVEHLRENGANGMSDMAGKAAREAVEPSGSERDTMLLALAFNCRMRQLRN